MGTKTIITTVTLHLKDEARSVALQLDPNGAVIGGKTVVIEILPGQPSTLDAGEADRILARFGGEIVSDAAPSRSK